MHFLGTYGLGAHEPGVRHQGHHPPQNPMYQNAFVGHADNLLLSGVIRSTAIEETVKIASRHRHRRAHAERRAGSGFVCYVAIDRKIEGEAGGRSDGCLSSPTPFPKFAVVVDRDVDITSDTEVTHAIATRVRAPTAISSHGALRQGLAPRPWASYDPERADRTWSPRWASTPPVQGHLPRRDIRAGQRRSIDLVPVHPRLRQTVIRLPSSTMQFISPA